MGHLVVDLACSGLDARAIAADCSEAAPPWTKSQGNHQEKFMPI
jgi:hypothetical protein